MLKSTFAATLLLFVTASASATSFVCSPSRAAEYPKILEADAIFVGEMANYEWVAGEGADASFPYAAMTFRVSETLKGNLPDEVP